VSFAQKAFLFRARLPGTCLPGSNTFSKRLLRWFAQAPLTRLRPVAERQEDENRATRVMDDKWLEAALVDPTIALGIFAGRPAGRWFDPRSSRSSQWMARSDSCGRRNACGLARRGLCDGVSRGSSNA
jgi:hypothetical protein